MKNPRAYDSYFGGKAGNGTYQTLINNIPPHRARYSLFAGNDTLAIHCKPAELNVLIDLDNDVIDAWERVFKDRPFGPTLWFLQVANAFDILRKDLTKFFDGDDNLEFEKEEVFIFLDPPYPMGTRKSQKPVYKFEMTDEQHAELISIVASPEFEKFKIMLCSYQNAMYDLLLLDGQPFKWYTVDYQSMTRNGLAWERIYMNYPPPTELHDYRYLGGNFRQRERIKRIKTNLLSKLSKMEPIERNAMIAEIVEGLNDMK